MYGSLNETENGNSTDEYATSSTIDKNFASAAAEYFK